MGLNNSASAKPFLAVQVNVHRLLYNLQQAEYVISHDTGLMHIASCFDIPTVSVWGNTVPALGMYSYFPEKPDQYSIHEVLNLKCRPCSKIGHQSCPKKHFNCMEFQDIEKIVKDVLNRMGN